MFGVTNPHAKHLPHAKYALRIAYFIFVLTHMHGRVTTTPWFIFVDIIQYYNVFINQRFKAPYEW